MSYAELLSGVASPVGIVELCDGRAVIRVASSEFRCLTGTAGAAEGDLLACTLRFEAAAFQRAVDAALGPLPEGAPSYAVPQGEFMAWSAGKLPHRVTVRRARRRVRLQRGNVDACLLVVELLRDGRGGRGALRVGDLGRCRQERERETDAKGSVHGARILARSSLHHKTRQSLSPTLPWPRRHREHRDLPLVGR